MRAPLFSKKTRVHFVGIGGIGMSGIAEVLENLGYTVSGSDLKSSASTARLRSLGVKVHEGHLAEHVEGSDVVVVSSAVKVSNPEVVEARRLQINSDLRQFPPPPEKRIGTQR